MKTVLTIAGSDSIGGAGIQADIKTLTMHGVYATSAVTALTAQNTLGVTDIMEVSPNFLTKQLDAIFTDIPPNAVKIGMLSSASIISVVAKRLMFYKPKRIVIDPVMVATSGSALLQNSAVSALQNELLPLATIITPNIPEAEVLSGMKIQTKSDRLLAAQKLSEHFSVAVLLKGGHAEEDADDILYTNGTYSVFREKRISNPNTHGTGCTLSSAIAANLAKGDSLETAVKKAKAYVSGALSAHLNLGKGSGPLNHTYTL